MNKEELAEKLKQIDEMYSPEDKIRILKEINAELEMANEELNVVYDEVRGIIDKEKAKKVLEAVNASDEIEFTS